LNIPGELTGPLTMVNMFGFRVIKRFDHRWII
jgi:hypothetical protein